MLINSKKSPSQEAESLEKEATHTLEEMRMVLPGVQALFGFQLIAVFNQTFDKILSVDEQRLHLVGVLLTAVTVALTMAPAAYHRQAEPHEISSRFLKLASALLSCGMFSLMLSLLVDCYLIAQIIVKQQTWSLAITGLMGAFYLGLWFVLPRLMRRSARRRALRLGNHRSGAKSPSPWPQRLGTNE